MASGFIVLHISHLVKGPGFTVSLPYSTAEILCFLLHCFILNKCNGILVAKKKQSQSGIKSTVSLHLCSIGQSLGDYTIHINYKY